MSMRGWLLLLVMALGSTGCASISGRPVGLTTCEDATLGRPCQKYKKDTLAAAENLQDVLKVADSLSSLYIGAREDNLFYAFWSNALYFPLGIAAAAYTIQKNHANALVNLGIASGALVGANTFINARPNAKVYQSGVNTMVCLTTQLEPFVTREPDLKDPSVSRKSDDVEDLQRRAGELVRSMGEASALLPKMDPLLNTALTGKAATEEQSRNPAVFTTLAHTRQALSFAMADAQKAIDSANGEISRFRNVISYAKSKIVLIDKFVETKITQPDINFQTLSKSLIPTSSATVTTKGAAPSETRLKAKVAPIEEVIAIAQTKTADLLKWTKEVATMTSTFGLSAAQKAVDDCISAM